MPATFGIGLSLSIAIVFSVIHLVLVVTEKTFFNAQEYFVYAFAYAFVTMAELGLLVTDCPSKGELRGTSFASFVHTFLLAIGVWFLVRICSRFNDIATPSSAQEGLFAGSVVCLSAAILQGATRMCFSTWKLVNKNIPIMAGLQTVVLQGRQAYYQRAATEEDCSQRQQRNCPQY